MNNVLMRFESDSGCGAGLSGGKRIKMKKPELLAPAGDFSKLTYAVEYGADAVYIGAENYSLRSAASNFTRDEMRRAVKYAHSRGVKVYAACNSVPHNEDLFSVPEYAAFLAEIDVDAAIITDLGMLSIFKETAPSVPLHISTQANTVNYAACNMWRRLGAVRIVLARELTLDEISEIRRNIPDDLELEAFVHGAVCMAHSGRCLLSNFFAGRDSNRGNCAQPCRWKYYLCEEKRPGEYYPVEESANGTYIMNAKDICMIDHIPDLITAGINSFKLEGRVKSEYYVSCITNAYRHAIDDCFEDLDYYYKHIKDYYEEVCKVSHREYSTGFYYGDAGQEGMNFTESSYVRDYELIGVVTGYDPLSNSIVVRQRNKFLVGDECEILEAGKPLYTFRIEHMTDEAGNEILAAPHADMLVKIRLRGKYVGSMSFLRRKKG